MKRFIACGFYHLSYLPCMNVKIRPEKYLRYLYLPNLFGTQRTKEILSMNPTIIPQREEANDVTVCVFDYDAGGVEEKKLQTVQETFPYLDSKRTSWVNIDGLRKGDIEAMSN